MLSEGSTDGKYRKRRPDTTLADLAGDRVIEQNRDGLNPFYNYGYVNSEAQAKVAPGSLS
jgi:hypothetical protein